MSGKKILAWCAALLAGAALLHFSPIAKAAQGAQARTLQVGIRERDVSTPESNPYDVAVAPDGALWWSGNFADRLGRLDPDTGILREFPLKTPGSAPLGLAFDRDGNAWYAANYAGAIGKLDPRTEKLTEYKLPDAAGDPRELVFDAQGVLWFTVSGGNLVGRLDPRTGKIDLAKAPTEDALPYGIGVTSKGVPIFCEFGTNKLAKIDPQTMAITEFILPAAGARPRQLAIAKDDTVYFTDYAEGHLGRLDLATGNVKMWPSPGGPESNPYGIAVAADGTVWYSEAGALPKNTLVRFDPRTETFAVAIIPSGGGIIRGMAATADGRIYMACSAVNKVAVVSAARARVR